LGGSPDRRPYPPRSPWPRPPPRESTGRAGTAAHSHC
jgi:hypothetical protein